MTTPDPLPPATAIATAVLPLPPAPRQETAPAPTSPRTLRRFDAVLAGLVVLLAFLAASTVARNGDLWQHLAAGRLLLQGQYHFGIDPFSYTTEGVYWANHAWLFDAAAYLVHGVAGGVGLVVVKALLVAVLAGLMLAVRRPSSGGAVPAGCTALALAAMSPRLLLQPALVSFFLLGLTFWLLWRPHKEDKPAAVKHYAWLLLVFALWVNLDGWFYLGPLLAGLFWVGERLGGARRTPAWLAPAGLAVCLINPHLWHAFTLPTELSPVLTATGLVNDPRFARLFVSPWQVGVHLQPAVAVSVSEWAYFLLLVVGLASFAVNSAAPLGWRSLVWLTFALLGAWQVRTVPFFAVVAAPIAALNFQDFLAKRTKPIPGILVGRWALAGSLTALLSLTLLGWLHGFRPDAPGIGWGIHADSSLQRVAETLGRWRQQGRLSPEDRVFNFHPDVAHYCAWFCPGEKTFLDARFSLLRTAATEYEAVCQALQPALRPANRKRGGADAEKVLRDRGVTTLVLFDPDKDRVLETMSKLSQESDRWELLRIDGLALLYRRGKNSPGAGAPSTDFRSHAARLAFDPRGEDDEQELPPAPGSGAGRAPRERSWWERPLRPVPPSSWESGAIYAWLQAYVNAAEADREDSRRRAAVGFAASLVTPPALTAGRATEADVLFRLVQSGLYLADGNERSPAMPLLAIRAARHALAANPDDASAWLHLARAYLLLSTARDRDLTPLDMLRHIQVVTALGNVLALAPDTEPAHQLLAALYLQRNFLDAALVHRQSELRLSRAAGPRPGEDADTFSLRLAQRERQVKDLEKQVQDQQNKFARRAPALGDKVYAKAHVAIDLGLARYALDEVLLKSQDLLFGTEGARLEIELMLMLGHHDKARALLDHPGMKDNRQSLGSYSMPAAPPLVGYTFPAYEWLATCMTAAAGDYDQAAGNLVEILHQLEAQGLSLYQPAALRLAVVAEIGLGAQPQGKLYQVLAARDRGQFTSGLVSAAAIRMESADLHVVAAVLALERGLPTEAKRHLDDALILADGLIDDGTKPPGRPLTLTWLRHIEAARAADAKRGAKHDR